VPIPAGCKPADFFEEAMGSAALKLPNVPRNAIRPNVVVENVFFMAERWEFI
jgi:hypothetical protein